MPAELGTALADSFGFGSSEREHVAFVGAGGKTTLLLALGRALTARGRRVLLTTTTRVGADEMAAVPFLYERRVGDKLVGPRPEVVDAAFASGAYDAVLVEADGARHRAVKAPRPHEPVIPSTASLVVAVMGADALDRVIEDVAFAPLRVAAAAGCGPYDRLTAARAARLLASEIGLRKGVPATARFGVALTRVTAANRAAVDDLVARLAAEGVTTVVLPHVEAPPR